MASSKSKKTPDTEVKDVKETPGAWQERVGSFAEKVGRPLNTIEAALESICGKPGDEALAVLADVEAAPDSELIAAFTTGEPRIPSGVVRKNLSLLRGPKPAAPIAEVTTLGSGPSYDVLPSVPDDEAFLKMLKVGGELKVGTTEVVAAIRCALASRVGLYDLPIKLATRMEEFADEQSEPCGEAFYRLRRMITSHAYGEVLAVLGVDGSYVSPTRKKTFLSRLDANLWGALISFHQQLVSWQNVWAAGANNPGLLMQALLAGQAGGPLPPGVMAPPPTDSLRDAAEVVIDVINRVFAGPGIPVARALAWDANNIKTVLEDPLLPATIGAGNRDQMLRALGVTVAADIVRVERNATRYALGIMEYPKVTAGNEDLAYLSAMLQLGAAIPWDKLEGESSAGIGKTRHQPQL